ncbi:hypothetical protein [Mariniflexile sp. HMF6888]
MGFPEKIADAMANHIEALNSMNTINKDTKQITYNSEYSVMKYSL